SVLKLRYRIAPLKYGQRRKRAEFGHFYVQLPIESFDRRRRGSDASAVQNREPCFMRTDLFRKTDRRKFTKHRFQHGRTPSDAFARNGFKPRSEFGRPVRKPCYTMRNSGENRRCGKRLQIRTSGQKTALDGLCYRTDVMFDLRADLCFGSCDKLRGGRRRRCAKIGDEIGYRMIDLVPDRRNYRNARTADRTRDDL